MKIITQKPQGFQPFSILVESQCEADLFTTLIGSTPKSVSELFGIGEDELYEMYSKLDKHSSDETCNIEIQQG